MNQNRRSKKQNPVGLGRGGKFSKNAGRCVCLKCGFSATKKRGIPCMEEKCPHCGAVLLREGGAHHLAAVEKTKHAKSG